MAERVFALPDLGEGLTEATVVAWLVEVGDEVAVDQPVVEVETAKAVVTVPTPFAGVVAVLHGAPGEVLDVGTPLITISTDAAAPPAAEPAVPAPAEEHSGNVLVGYGTRPATRRRRAGTSAPTTPTPPARAGNAAPRSTPPVRKLAKELGVDLAGVTGTGRAGIITRDDVLSAAGSIVAASTSDNGDERIAMSPTRRAIAERLSASRRTIPEVTTWVDADAEDLVRLLGTLQDSSGRTRVGVLAYVLRACVAGLRRFPVLNASLDEARQEIVVHRAVHLGVAAQTARGLVVPVVRHADRLSAGALADEVRRLAAGAREGTLTPTLLSGSTFTVTNYGVFGVDGGTPIINPPEVAILGLGRVVARPRVHNGVVTARRSVELTLAFDHRVCDGAEAAGFLRFVADCIERPALLLAEA